MSEERKMILNMLSEGKITVEQATQLLNAVSDKDQQKSEKKSSNLGARVPREFKPNDEDFNFNNEDFKKSIRDAKIASKEAMQTVKDSVREAIEESRKALKEISRDISDETMAALKSKKVKDNVEKIRAVSDELADDLEEAEGEFEEAKELHEEVQELKDEIAELNDYLQEIQDLRDDNELSEQEATKQTNETHEKISKLKLEKERLANEAKLKSEEAQERMLEVRRRCKELGISFDNNVSFEQEISDQFENMGEVISKATSQIGPMITKFFDGFSFSGMSGYQFKEEFTFTPEDPNENIVINTSLQNGSVKIYGEEGRNTILVKVYKRVRGSNEVAKSIAEDMMDIKCGGNIVNIEVKKKFNNRHSASVEIYAPIAYNYDCHLKSTNGSISLSGIKGKAWLLNTSNGSISCRDGSVEKLKAGSSNGSLKFFVNAKEADLVTSNGSIKLFVPENAVGETNLTTSNGSIKVYADENVSARMSAKTNMGTIKVDDYWVVTEAVSKRSKKSKVAQTKAFSHERGFLDIRAKTSNGSIKFLEQE